MSQSENLYVRLQLITKDFEGHVGKVTSGFGKIGTAIKGLMAFQIASFFISQFGRSVKALADFEYQMDKVAAISGASSDEIRQLTDNAFKLAGQTKFTAMEIGKLQEVLSRRGFESSSILRMTDDIVKLAEVSSSSLSATAGLIGSISQSFKVVSSDTGRVANVLAEAFASTNLELVPFATGIAYVGSVAPKVGVSLEYLSAAMGLIANSSEKASKAGRGLRTMFSKLNDEGMTLEDAFNRLSESQNQLAEANALVGVNFGSQLLTLYENRDALDQLTEKYSDNNKEINKQIGLMRGNLTTEWGKFTSNLNSLLLKQGAVTDFLTSTTKLLNNVATAAGNLGKTDFQVMEDFYSKIKVTDQEELDAQLHKIETFKKQAEKVKAEIEELSSQTVYSKEQAELTSNKLSELTEKYDAILGKISGLGIATKGLAKEFEKQRKATEGLVEVDGEWIQNINSLNAQIDILQEKRNETSVLDLKEIASLTKQIEKIKEKIFYLKNLASAQKRAGEAMTAPTALGSTSIDAPDITSNEGDFKIPNIEDTPVGKRLAKYKADSVYYANQIAEQMSQGIGNAFANAGLDLGSAFADFAIASSKGIDGASKTLESSVANIAGSLGQALVTLGTGSIAFQQLLKDIFSGAGAAFAVVTGAALIAYSKTAKTNIQSQAQNASKSPGGGSSSSGMQSPDYGAWMDATKGEMAFRISGTDLVTVLNAQSRLKRVNG